MSTHKTTFTDKIIWITGASSGIGEQLALLYSAKGARLILSARRHEELGRVRTSCLDPSKISIVQIDQSDEASVKAAAREVIKNNPEGIDCLVLCGGISQRSMAEETPVDIDRKILEVNFFSNVILTKMILPTMKGRGGGTIVVISSLMGKWGFSLRTAYAASKHALHGFFNSLRMEVENQGIRIVLVTPGFISTEISRSALNKDGKATGEMDTNQLHGMSAKECAAIIVNKVLAGKDEFAVGGRETLGILVQRFFPRLFERILRKQPLR